MEGPIPPVIDLLASIRSSCHALRLESNILIDEKAADEFLLGLDQDDWEREGGANQHGIRLPLRFDTPEEELNVICTLSLLNFLSGYRAPLHRLTTRGAWSTILSLVLSAHLSSSPNKTPLSAVGMISSTPASLAALTQIVTHTEKDHPTMGPAVKMGEKDEEAWEILELLAGVLNQTGTILKDFGKRNLGEWVKEALLETLGDAEEMIEKLATTFPAFRDSYIVDDKPVYLFKKALFLLTAITLRFSPKLPSSDPDADSPPELGPVHFPVPSIDTLPIFADNVIPTMLLHHRLLLVNASSDPAIAALSSRFSLPATPEQSTSSIPLSTESCTRLRASAVDLCSHLVNRARAIAGEREDKKWLGGLRDVELDGYLWALAKKGSLRDVGRIEERGTVFY